MGISSQLAAARLIQPGVCTSSTRPASPFEGQMIYETDTNNTLVYNGSAWICTTPQVATVATNQSTTSSTYTDLTTAGPAVTLQTGTSALVTVCFTGYNGTGAGYLTFMGVAVSGATTIAAADTLAAVVRYDNQISASVTTVMTGLTAGSNTFTSKYKVTAGTTGYFSYRSLTVVGLP